MRAFWIITLIVFAIESAAQRTQRINGELVPNDTLKWKADLVSTTKLPDLNWSPEPFTFYIGIENAYSLVAKDLDFKQIKATISSGEVVKVDQNKIIVRINAIEENITLRLYAEKNGRSELINQSIFKSRHIPILDRARSQLDYENRGISVTRLRKSSVRELLNVPDNAIIKSWTFTIDVDQSIWSLQGVGERFTESMRQLINKTQGGRLITFDNIRIIVNGETKTLPSRIWYVKD